MARVIYWEEIFSRGWTIANLNILVEVTEENTTRDIHTGRKLNLVSSSLKGDAEIDQSLSQAAVKDSNISGAKISGTYNITALELMNILIESGSIANARIDSKASGMLNSRFTGGNGDDQLTIESDMGMQLKAINKAEKLDLDLRLSSIGVEKSNIELGDGDDKILIHAKIVGSPKENTHHGIDIDLTSSKETTERSIDITASAIGADRESSIDTGDGDDRVEILSSISDYLESDFNSLKPNENKINIQRNLISLNNSNLTTGAGNDLVMLRAM